MDIQCRSHGSCAQLLVACLSRCALVGPNYKEVVGFFGALPTLRHNGFEMCQSIAIQSYLASIAPRYASLTPEQKATDDMFCCTLEDVLAGCAKVYFAEDKSNAKQDVTMHLDKFFTVIEVR
eukprot:SAG31_NODE_4145_length_3534_cov_3.048326_1_plen_122_part_00